MGIQLLTPIVLLSPSVPHVPKGSAHVLHLELVWLQFSFSRFGGERWHIGADGHKSFGVCVKHDGRDKAVGCAHCYTYIHYMVPGNRSK